MASGKERTAEAARAQPLSVIIPTRDRAAILARTLAALRDLRAELPALDVIVVDDGSASAPGELSSAADPHFDVRILRRPALGPAAARNFAIARARHERILLLGDDTRPAPGCLKLHACARDGLQGRIEWDPQNPVTPVMQFLAPAGPQFWFAGLVDGAPIPFTGILGSNYSAPAAWFRAEPYDEGFRDAAFEDTELAWRFRLRGYRSRFSAAAICWHDHAYESIEPFLTRQERAGEAARYGVSRHPALAWWALARPLAVELARRTGLRPIAPALRQWDRHCRHAYLRGFFGWRSSSAGAVA
ncbi:MAG: glycosyltransferase [Thermoanaerobaculia bacterium]